MVNTEIGLIILFAAKVEKLYSPKITTEYKRTKQLGKSCDFFSASQCILKLFTLYCTLLIGEGNGETYSRVLAWRIPGMAEPGGLPSMGSHRVGQD